MILMLVTKSTYRPFSIYDKLGVAQILEPRRMTLWHKPTTQIERDENSTCFKEVKHLKHCIREEYYIIS